MLRINGYEIIRHTEVDSYFVYGERSSGTNLMNHLIQENLNLTPVVDRRWKHGFPLAHPNAPNTLAIVIFRAPLNWVCSMYAKPWHANAELKSKTFSEFIRHPWVSIYDTPRAFKLATPWRFRNAVLLGDLNPLTGLPFANIAKLRTAKASAMLGIRHVGWNVMFVRYETLVDDPTNIIKSISAGFDVDRKPGSVSLPKKNLGGWTGGNTRTPQRPEEISEIDIKYLSAQLNFKLEDELGYLKFDLTQKF